MLVIVRLNPVTMNPIRSHRKQRSFADLVVDAPPLLQVRTNLWAAIWDSGFGFTEILWKGLQAKTLTKQFVSIDLSSGKITKRQVVVKVEAVEVLLDWLDKQQMKQESWNPGFCCSLSRQIIKGTLSEAPLWG